jgi:acyl carrier protein
MFKADPANATRLLRDYRADDPACRYVSSRHLGGWLTVAARLPQEPAGESPPVSTTTFETVASRVAGVLRVPESGLTPQTTMKDLGADSFMLVEMIVDLQEELDAVCSQASLREVGNLGELAGLLHDSVA